MTEPHPVRLRLADDLHRSRLTVFFRILLAIPHFIWFVIWSIGVFFVAIAQWLYTLVRGRTADGMHEFLSSYVRYAVQLNGYFWLVANPYPTFGGDEAYPVTVELPSSGPQARWKTLLRVLLAVPALFVSAFLAGTLGPSFGSAFRRRNRSGAQLASGGALVAVCGILGWFASLARGRMPQGLRDANAYAIGYGAQVLAYVLLVTDRYPNADPAPLLEDAPSPPPHPVGLNVAGDLRRSRVTVFFRLPLAIPHLVWLALWTVAVLLASIVNWFATLATGRPLPALHRFLSAYIRYGTHVNAFLSLIGNPFPGFTGTPGSYPVDVRLPELSRQSRGTTAFRIFLALPAWLVNTVLGYALIAAAIVLWFAALATGSVPEGLRNLGAYALRYSAQLNAYLYLVTDRYPHASPLERSSAPEPADVPPSP